MNTFDVAVIGSGPAGSLAAIKLAKRGLKTVVFEKEELPRRKICAGGLVKRAADLLPSDLEYPVSKVCDTFELRVCGATSLIKATRENLIRMVVRKDFDFALLQYARSKGALLQEKREVTRLIPAGEKVTIKAGDATFSASYVILAEGANSRLANQLWGAQPMAVPSIEADIIPSQEILAEYEGRAIFDLDAVPRGYGWVFPKSDHLSVGLVSFRKGKVDLQKHFESYLGGLGLLGKCEVKNRKGFIIPVKPRKPPYMKERVLLVGDAAGFADPISAEGLSYAIMSGIAAGEAVAEGFSTPRKVEETYHRRISTQFLQELHAASRFTALIYDFPALRNIALRSYGKQLGNGVLDAIEGKRRIADLTTPSSILLHLLKLR